VPRRRRPALLLLWDAPAWFPRRYEGTAWFVFGSIATLLMAITTCFATDAFDRISGANEVQLSAAADFARKSAFGGARELVVTAPRMASARAAIDLGDIDVALGAQVAARGKPTLLASRNPVRNVRATSPAPSATSRGHIRLGR
jgi:hypothetical protein